MMIFLFLHLNNCTTTKCEINVYYYIIITIRPIYHVHMYMPSKRWCLVYALIFQVDIEAIVVFLCTIFDLIRVGVYVI